MGCELIINQYAGAQKLASLFSAVPYRRIPIAAAIPGSQIEDELKAKRNIDIDLSKTNLDEGPKNELKKLFNSCSKIKLNFDKKTLTIPDSQIEDEIIAEGNIEIDLSKTNLEEGQKNELKNPFNSFKVLFSDKPALTLVLYHEIGIGDKPPVVSQPYR
ncbi:hypothetical protein TNCV_4374851 [Trichonephila clavipes]|uniref:Uncharacterized protein n=1 Tax=Trichonephila clavipes TaxID=2585209 RepID=A0A8X6W267_TRICX|nr:hypothetical protein TNCV_4374851 [Trichonephila clavipes]